MLNIRGLGCLSFLLGTVCALAAGPATAQGYPTKPITMIVPLQPGTTADAIVRIISPEMGKFLGQPIVVDNKPGANSMIAYDYVARQAPADGYTMSYVIVGDLALLPVTARELRFDPLKDLPPFISLAEARYVLGSSSALPWTTFNELVANAKANPGKLNFGSASPSTRLPLEAIIRDLGLDMVHVPYPAGAPFQQALIRGDIHAAINSEGTAIGLGDKVRVLAVTGDKRSASLPNVPTFAELGYPQLLGIGASLNTRAGTPKVVTDKLHAAAASVLQQPGVKALLAKVRYEIASNQTPEAAAKRLADEGKFVADVANKIGMKPE